MSLWRTRDEPVLRHLAEHPPEYSILWTQSRSDALRPGVPGVSEREFHRSVIVLSDAGYVSYRLVEPDGGGGCNFQDFQVTGSGMQALGLWPMFDELGSPGQLAALLDALGRNAATEEERTNLQRTASAVRRSAPDVVRAALAGGIGALVRAHVGL
jgi:hypothetical protein